MRLKTINRALGCGAAAIAIAACCSAAPAAAQAMDQADANTADGDATDDDNLIVVTGSIIANPNLTQSNPVNVVGADEIEFRQTGNAEELLREIPGVVPSIGSTINNGNNGAAFTDLRGLGANRNIVLLDGHRIVPANFAGVVDLNNIPLALVERVDALTGAAVTTYGADAITGVVNFVTKRRFTGFELAASSQITERGDGAILRIDATLGSDFADGRGNAVFSIGYQKAHPVYQGARDFSLNTLDSFSNQFIGSSTAVPSRFGSARPIDPATGLPSTDPDVLNGGLKQIDPATGAAIPGYSTFNFNPYNIFQTPFDRFNIFGQASYEISDGFEVYTRGMFSKNKVKTVVAPSGSFSEVFTLNLNNPFMPDLLRRQFCAFNVAAPGSGLYTPRYSEAECDAAATATGPDDPDYRTVDSQLNRRAVEFGPRIDTFQTTLFDYRLGLRGDLTPALRWDVNGSYGESENIRTRENYVISPLLRQSIRVGGTIDNPVCEDASAGCVPTDVFGEAGSISQEAIGFISGNTFSFNRSSLLQAQGTISGDLFTLPWASTPIGGAVGVEYRKYKARQQGDQLESTPGAVGGAGGIVAPFRGGYDVREVFGELVVPVIEDSPFAENITIDGGVRFSNYKVDTAGSPKFDTFTYKAGASWDFGAGVKIRGNYSHAVRAPNIGELFGPFSVGLTNLAVDPCAGAAPTNNANLRAVCLAQGAPAGAIGAIPNPISAQANINAGGNTQLQPEKANTYTVGLVLQPDFLPGFSFSADYYNIKVKDTIGAPLPGDLISACFGNLTAASASDPACTVIRRNPSDGGLSGSASNTPGLFAQLSNLGRLSTDGIDVMASYQRDFGDVRLNLNFAGNWTNSTKYQATPSSIVRECAGYYSVNCAPSPGAAAGSIQPKYQFTQRTTLSYGDVDLSLLWRWLGSSKYEPQQFADDLAAAQGAPDDCPDPLGDDPGGCMVDPQFRKIDTTSYFDLSVRFNVSDAFKLTATVVNLFDKQPPIVGNTLGTTTFNSGNTFPATYDPLGRRFAVTATMSF